MKYFLVGNYNYYITDTAIYSAITNEEIIPDNGWYKIEVYGKLMKRKFEWFYLMSKYDIKLPVDHRDKIDNIAITKITRHDSVFNSMPVIAQSMKPLICTFNNEEYAYILNEEHLAISKKGILLDLLEKIIIDAEDVDPSSNKYKYATVRGKRILLHRACLLAWEFNDNPLQKPICNHIDGNKNNNHIDNLEWISPSDNIRHAYANKLIGVNVVDARIRNAITGEEKQFTSIGEMCRFLNIASRTKSEIEHMNPMCLINGYEIRVSGDDRDWYYKDYVGDVNNGLTPPKIYNIVQIINRRIIKRFISLENIVAHYNIESELTYQAVKCALHDKYPNYDLAIETLNITGPYECYNIPSGTVFKANTVSELVNLSGVAKPTIHRMLRQYNHGKIYSRDGWVFRVESDQDWNIEKSIARNILYDKRIEVKYLDTGESKIYPTVIAVAKDLNITRKTIRSYLYSGLPYKNMCFKALDATRYIDKVNKRI